MQKVRFKPNWAQEEFYHNTEGKHGRHLILKARQLGFSTHIRILCLDTLLFEPNTQAGLIADTLDNAKALLLNKDRFALHAMDDWVKPFLPGIEKENETEIRFSNGSFIVAGASLRSGTYSFLHISEYGKSCARFPLKAAEIRSGALNTAPPNGRVYIESTAEGASGDFYDKCQAALVRPPDARISPLQYAIHFYPWYREPRYVIPPAATVISSDDRAYFAKLEKDHGITLSEEQQAWYVDKKEEQQEEMLREFPSTEDEAFAGASQGNYYGRHMMAADREGRIGGVRPNPEKPVFTFWDLGLNDMMVIWFMQFGQNEKRFYFDCYANTGYGLAHYLGVLKDKKREYGFAFYGAHVLPHDADNRKQGPNIDPTTTADDLRGLGLADVVTMPRGDLLVGINKVRQILPMCYFDKAGCKDGIRAMRSYRRMYNEGTKSWATQPLHDWASDYADAFRTQIGFEPDIYERPPAPDYMADEREEAEPDDMWMI